MIALVDSGGSNINSVSIALQRLGKPVQLTADPEVINSASHVVLPGVGAAPRGMAMIMQRELVDCLQHVTQPLLGICLGMQLLYESSDEGDTPCLGVFPGRVKQLLPKRDFAIPHMGWNQLRACESPLLSGLEGAWFYFVHGYSAPLNDACVASVDHGETFCAVAQKGNYYGTQFHPEKSALAGERLLQNFIGL